VETSPWQPLEENPQCSGHKCQHWMKNTLSAGKAAAGSVASLGGRAHPQMPTRLEEVVAMSTGPEVSLWSCRTHESAQPAAINHSSGTQENKRTLWKMSS